MEVKRTSIATLFAIFFLFSVSGVTSAQIRFEIDSIKKAYIPKYTVSLTGEDEFNWPVLDVCGKLINESDNDIVLIAFVSNIGYMESIINIKEKFIINTGRRNLKFDYVPTGGIDDYGYFLPWRSITYDDGTELAYIVIPKGGEFPYGYVTVLEMKPKDYHKPLKHAVCIKLRKRIIKHISTLHVNTEVAIKNFDLYHEYKILHDTDELLKIPIVQIEEEELLDEDEIL